jgi:hypothetical protein
MEDRVLPIEVPLQGVMQGVMEGVMEGVMTGGPAPVHPTPEPGPWVDADEPLVDVPLVRLAWARSGDKGNTANIGVIARRPEWLPLLWARLTPQAVAAYLAHLVHGPVQRFHLPGIHAMNFLLHEALDGGGPASRRMDPLGKGLAQILLDMPVRVPASWLE